MLKKFGILLVLGLFVIVVAYRFLITKNNQGIEDSKQTPTSVEVEWDPDADESIDRPIKEIIFGKSGFSPKTVNISKGTVVVWTNSSGGMVTVHSSPHPAHTDFPVLNLGELADGNKFSLLFTTPGTYKYHNHLNASQFGTIIVTE